MGTSRFLVNSTYGAACVSRCPTGQAPNDKAGSTDADMTCTDCAADESADHENHICVTSCPSTSAYIQGRDCVSECAQGSRFLDSTKCVSTCPTGQGAQSVLANWDRSDVTCLACESGKVAEHYYHRCVHECPFDYLKDSTNNERVKGNSPYGVEYSF